MTYKYLVVMEKTETGFSAYSPDVPGCVAAGKTAEAVGVAIRDAIEFHLEGLAEFGKDIPKPRARHLFAVVDPPALEHAETSAYHVIPGHGQWVVKRSGASRASRVYPSKNLAVQYGRALAQKHAAQLVIHNKDGRITFVKGSDNETFYEAAVRVSGKSDSKTGPSRRK